MTQPKKYKKRIVAGIKEVNKSIHSMLTTNKVKCVIIAINLDNNPYKGKYIFNIKEAFLTKY